MGRWAAEEWIAQRALEESNGLENSTGLDNLSQSQNPNLSATDQSLQNAPAETETSPKSNTLNPPSKSNSSDQIWKVSFKELRDAFDSVIAVRYSQPIHLGGQSR
jgi:cleavage and polyadenylation specificity factor subunit 2